MHRDPADDRPTPVRRGDVRHAVIASRRAAGGSVTKVRPVVVWTVHADHVHVVPLTSRARPGRALRARIPGGCAQPYLFDMLVEVPLRDLDDGPPVTRLGVPTQQRIGDMLGRGVIGLAAPRRCVPLDVDRRAEVASARPEVDGDPEALLPRPTPVPVDEAFARLQRARLVRVGSGLHDDVLAA